MNGISPFCSTGTVVDCRNGYNIRYVSELFAPLMEAGIIDGAELMMLTRYYDCPGEVCREWLGAGVRFPVIHCEKNVGTLLSDGAAAAAAGDAALAASLRRRALEDFQKNCEMGAMAGSSRMVLHLWGGLNSDRHLEYNLSVLPELLSMIRPYGIRLLIENVPSNTNDPLSNWRRLRPFFPQCGLIFDTRFGQLHRQIGETWADTEIASRIEHVHISDIIGAERDFSTLRPILHPGEGMIDFEGFARILRDCGYRGSATLESPVYYGGGADGVKLRETLLLLRQLFGDTHA